MELRAQARKERRAELQRQYDEKMKLAHEKHLQESQAREQERKRQKQASLNQKRA
jgi:hypothetical protein